MKLIVASSNPVKINSVKESLKHCVYFPEKDIEVEGIAAASDVSDMPTSLDEVILGAKNRAHNLKKKGISADFFIGIEGGTTLIGTKAYLLGCTYILSHSGEEHFGLTSLMEVPLVFQKGIYEDGRELGDIQNEINNTLDIGKKNGSYGMWTDDMITRQSAFETSFFCAISPFFNKFYTLK